MTPEAVARAAKIVAENRRGRARLQHLPERSRPQTIDDAYTVQARMNERLTAGGLGETVGWKIGCTTPVMQEYMNIHECAYGEVFEPTLFRRHVNLRHADYVEPGVEAEIAVELGADLPAQGPGGGRPWTRDSVADAVAAVMASIELVDARYADFRTFDTPTLVADNFFNAAVVLGAPVTDWRGLDLGAATGRMRINGEIVGEGPGSLIMGHPFEALAWLANRVADFGRHLRAGEFVTLGSVVATHWIQRSDLVAVEVDGLGAASIQFD
jgi:2-oxo-3-hexenedioate decarboxylase/2-keto-4-pentenoate hydratase